MTELIDLTISDACATLTLSRSEKLNSLTPSMLSLLTKYLDEIESRTDIRVVVLTADGHKAFCVGADIHAWADLSPLDMWRQWVVPGHRIFDRLAQLRMPVVALINGLALGGGLELAAAADIRIAASNAKFALPEAKVATTPGWSGSQRLVKEMGPGWVKAMALAGQWWDAQQAKEQGFVQEVCELDELHMVGQRWVNNIVQLAPISVQINKQMINAAQGEGVAAAIESLGGAVAAATQDAQEGKQSFFEKRTGQYQGQ